MRAFRLGAAIVLVAVACEDGTSPLTPSVLDVHASPETGIAGANVATRPAVRITSADGRPVPGVEVAFTITAGGGSLNGDLQATNGDGVATVASWTLGPKAGINKLSAAVAGLSHEFTVEGVAGPPAKLVLTTLPSPSAANRAPFATQPSVRLLDANDNDVGQAGVVVTVVIAAGSGTLLGTTTAATGTDGVAAFTDLAVAGAAGERTLSFSADGLSGASAPVSTTNGAATTLSLLAGDGQSAIVATPVATPPAVRVTDADGNPVGGVPVSFSIAGGNGTAAGSPAVSDASGIAAVGSWTLGTVAGGNALAATSDAVAGTSITFNATGAPGPATSLVLTATPGSTAQNRSPFAAQPVLQLQDAHGNAAPQAGIEVIATITGGGGALQGTLTRLSSGAGVVTFTDLAIAGLAGARTITFSAAGLTSATVAITTTAGEASAVTVHAGDTQTSVVQTAVAVAPAVKVSDQDGNAVSGVAVTFAVSAGGGSVTGGTSSTNVNGIASAGAWTLGAAVGANTLSASAAGVPGSVAISATAGTIEFVPIITAGLTQPVLATAPLGDPRLFIVDQRGQIRVYKNGTLLATPYLDVSARLRFIDEQGLLGLAFHPDFQTNGYFYVKYSTVNGDTNRVERYHASPSADVADAASATEILVIPQPFSNHNGGMLLFGPDRKLWIGTGDGGDGGDPNNFAQSLGSLLGKMLRIDVDAGTPYAVPPDNPFTATPGARPEIWALGLRNPWRYAMDPVTSLLFVADVGQSAFEEVNVVSTTRAGVNYGWRIMEGAHCFNPNPCDPAGLELPILEYGHAEGCSITGGFVYRGTALPGLQGHYFYGDLCVGFVRSFRYLNGAVTDTRSWSAGGTVNPIFSFGVDGAGEHYILSAGTVYRLQLRTN